MFCPKCGSELPEGTRFCPKCGAPAATAENVPAATPSSIASQPKPSENILLRFWNSPKFGWAAVKCYRAMSYVYIVLGILLWAGIGQWMFGLFFIANGAFGVYHLWKHKHQRSHTACPNCGQEVKIGTKFCKNCGAAIPVQKIAPETLADTDNEMTMDGTQSLRVKKINLLAMPFVILLFVWIFATFGDSLTAGPVYQIKNASLDQYGSQKMEQVVDDNFRGADWSSERLDDGCYLVSVEGYMPLYSQDVRITFYYENQGDGTFYFRVNGIDLLDSGESYSSAWEIALFLGILYS